MASWIVHMRITDALLDRIPNLDVEKFVVGNISPDCGAVTAVQGEYDPPNRITHYSPGGKKRDCETWRFRDEYLPDPDPVRNSFYLGYYTHLLTDRLWFERVFTQMERENAQQLAADPDSVFVMKQDWYDLDALYLREHPNFHAYRILCSVKKFENTYLDFYSKTAIEEQLHNIPKFYEGRNPGPDRVFRYVTKATMDAFVDFAAEEILRILRRDGLIA